MTCLPRIKNDQKVFIQQLIFLRIEQNMSYARLAELSDINVATVFELLNGKNRTSSWLTVAAVAGALGMRFLLTDGNAITIDPRGF